MQGVAEFVRQTNSADERGLVTCPFEFPCPKGAECWFFHEERDCIPFVLGGECNGCDLNHSTLAKEYHATPRPCLYSDADAEMLRACNRDVAAILAESRDQVLWDPIELIRFREQLIFFDATRDRNQLRYVGEFLMACGERWRDKVQLLELFFRRNHCNTWLTAQKFEPSSVVQTPDGRGEIRVEQDSLHVVCWHDRTTPTAYRLNISTRPRLQSVQEMMHHNPEGYRQNFERLREAGVIIILK